ncbi:MAG TPA: MBG domain-containing protein, partial [Verrucomicrobiae bacterium]|nr:MBG domain-containing protein [Verrucomicrobiae bacterium]
LTNLLQFVGGSVSGSMSLNNGGQLVNAGSLNWTATTLDDGNGSLISNAPAGTFNLTVNLSEGSFGGTRTFNNAGQLNVTVPGTANISEIFNSSGTVAISGGTLNLSGGGTETGSITVASGTTNEFGSGTFSMIAGATISGAGVWLGGGGVVNFTASSVLGTAIVDITGGTVNFNNTTSLIFPVLNLSGGGILAGSNPVTVSGPFTWSGGTIVTNLVQFNGGSFSNSFSLNNGGQVINTGTLNWTATTVNDGNGSVISNAPTGIINLATNVSEGSFGGTHTFNNGGQLNVAVTGTANISDNFTNTGTVTFNAGILNLSGTHNLAGGTLNFGIKALNNYGSNVLAGAAGLAGTLKSVFNGGYLPSVGNTYNIMTYGSSSGSYTTTNLSPLAVWTVNQNTAALSITVVKLVPQIAWANPADIVYGTALGGSQLNATATWNGTNVPGVFNYTPVSGTVLNSGSNQLLSVTFVPTDPSTFVSASSNVLINVQKAPLTVTATNITKTYGQTYTFAGTEFTASGLVNGDVVTSATLSSPGAAPTANVAGSPYAITINNAVGDAGLTNYNISYTGAQLSVGPANLGITAKNQTKIYGQVFTFTGTEFTPAGLQNSETVGSVTLTSLGAPATASVAGSPYNIVPSAATGGTFDPNNYSINYFNGALTVNKASLTIMADNTNKIVGESLTFAGNEFTASGLQNSETVGSVTLASTGAPAAAGVGGYPIVPSAPTGGTFSQGNYANSFVNGTLNVVAPPPLSIALNGNQDILTFQAMLGQSYQVQTETNLTLSSWTPLGSPISSKNGIVNVTNNISVPPGFYRLQIQLGP